MLIEAFIPKLAVEGLDEGILRGLAKLDQLQLDIALIDPLIKRLAGGFGALVGANRLWVAAKPRYFAQCPVDTSAADPVFHQNANPFLGEVISYCQAFDPPSRAERIDDEVHRLDLIRCA